MSAVFEIKSTFHKDEKVHSSTLDFKLSAIAYAEAQGNRSSARKFNVDVKRIREWKKGKAAIADKKGRDRWWQEKKDRWRRKKAEKERRNGHIKISFVTNPTGVLDKEVAKVLEILDIFVSPFTVEEYRKPL